MDTVDECVKLSAKIRKTIIGFAEYSRFDEHWGGSLSCVEILAVLYSTILNCKYNSMEYRHRDKLILSKGHAAMALYATLAEVGLMEREALKGFQANGSSLSELAIFNEEAFIEHSGGSLGLGLPMGIGMALLAKKKNYEHKIYVIAGDGECNEGSIWEAIMLAPQLRLDNLCFILDNNNLQSDQTCDEILDISNIDERIKSFGWDTYSIDGHDINMLNETFKSLSKSDVPKAVIAHTVKGKGVSFMENAGIWHHKKLSKNQLDIARAEVLASD